MTACLLSTLKKSGGFLLLFMDYWDYRPVILIITVITGFQGLLTCNYTGLQARSYTDYGITRSYIVGDNKGFQGRGTDGDTRITLSEIHGVTDA